jgi:signal transduction histidine kinase
MMRAVVRAGAAEVVLAFAAGAATFAVVGVILAAADSGVVAALAAVACVVLVVATARGLGSAFAAPVAIAALVAFDWYQFPPTHPHRFPDSGDLANLVAYLAVGVLVGELGALGARRAQRSEAARSKLATEQAALRRVATLVAHGVPPDDLFAAVGREAATLIGADGARVIRYVSEDELEQMAGWIASGHRGLPMGRAKTGTTTMAGRIRATKRVVRMDDYSAAADAPEAAYRLGIRSGVGAPIVVEGALWGAMIAWRMRLEPLPATAEARLAGFTELIATAISNSANREALMRLADEQAALRRVAMLVAGEQPPDRIFTSVAEEMARLLGVDDMRMVRYEAEEAVVVGTWGDTSGMLKIGTRSPLGGDNVSTLVQRTSRPARIDDFSTAGGPVGELVRAAGIRSAAGAPIVVNGRVWGAMIAASRRLVPLPAGTEERLGQFTELIATAVANVQARADLAASRARLLEATDDERRRLVRDLHDGAQQRLVHTVITLKLAQRALPDPTDSAGALVREGMEQAERAMAELHELAHGILPSVLTREGLRAGVQALAQRMPVPVELDVAGERLPAAVEATAYFVVAEALTNVAKHARARSATVGARVEGGMLCVRVCDDGVGGARADGTGLQGLADRLAVLDGSLLVESPPEGGTLVRAAIPIAH